MKLLRNAGLSNMLDRVADERPAPVVFSADPAVAEFLNVTHVLCDAVHAGTGPFFRPNSVQNVL